MQALQADRLQVARRLGLQLPRRHRLLRLHLGQRLQPTVPRDLETICLKCLRKEVGRRYATAQDLADDLRRFRAAEPIRARPVGSAERVVAWCRRKPAVAGLLAALVLVFLAGSAGVLWQWQRASHNAAAFRRERDTAERRLQLVQDQVDRLNRLGRDLLQRPGQYRTGQALLEQTLALYQQMLPEEGNDPRVRREAAKLFGQVGLIYYTLGQADKSAEYYDRKARLLIKLLQEEPGDKTLRMELADSHRWLGNALRLQGETRQAREAYKQAAKLHEELLDDSPNEALYQVALANTLLNAATLLAPPDELEALYRRIVQLDRDAVHAVPKDPRFQHELALGLEAQGLFSLEKGRVSEAKAAVREALKIQQKLLDGGHLKGPNERYAARSFVSLGRVLAAAGHTEDAEKCYRQAVNPLERLVKELPESALCRTELAQALAGLADLLKDPDRREEAKEIRRRVVGHYEALTADFPKEPRHRRNLVLSYLKLVSLLWELGRQSEAAEPYRKALELDPENHVINNDRAWFLATSPEPGLWDAALAVQLAKKAVKARPKTGSYRNTLGVALYRNGDYKAAVAELETAISLHEGGSSFDWFFLAMAHWRLGERDEARTWFDRAVQWMEKYQPHDDELRRFRAEAEAMLADMGKR